MLNLLLEAALAVDGQTPKDSDRWTIAEKVGKARAATARPASMGASAWRPLMTIYAETDELRHYLVHRAVATDNTGALVWRDRRGKLLGRPVTREEQDARSCAVLRAAQLVTAPVREERVEDDLVHQLGELSGVHGLTLPRVPQYLRLGRMTAIIPADPATPGSFVLDVQVVKAISPWPDAAWVDVIVQFSDRPGHELRGRLERALDAVVSIDPDAPPTGSRRRRAEPSACDHDVARYALTCADTPSR